MTGINSDLATSCGRIAEIERRIEALHHRVAKFGAESADARYARTALDVLGRSLKLMYLQRDRMESEVKRQQKQVRRQAKRLYPSSSRARAAYAPDLRGLGHKARPREWQKRAGA